MKKVFLVWLTVILGTGIFGCGTGKDISAAGDAVPVFHARLDAEDYATIYSQTDPRFKAATSKKISSSS